MKKFLLAFCFVAYSSFLSAQVKWDGEGDGISWNDASNWVGDLIPGSTDNVVLDNSILSANYIVTLPAGAVSTTINTLTISPVTGNTIRLILPATNTAAPALTMSQNSGDAILIDNGGVLENSNTAVSGTVINILGAGKTRINNGGRYIHNCNLNSLVIVASLSAVAGTELGVFEFAQGSFTSIPTNTLTYGSIELSTTSTKSFTTTGTTDVVIRGFLKINAGVTFSTTKNGSFYVAGDLMIDGIFDLSPPSSVGARSIFLNGTSNQTLSGTGNFIFGTNFLNITVVSGATVTLQRGITFSNTSHNFIVNNGGTLQMGTNIIDGTGRFQLLSGGWLGIGSPGGISSGSTGNVQTSMRSFANTATYEYNSGPGVPQVTGNALPSTVSGRLKINSLAGLGTTGVSLSTTIMVSGVLELAEGKFTTSAPSNLLFMGSSSTTTATYTDNSFVNGPMYKDGNSNYVFPVGNGVNIHPVGITTTGGDPGDRIRAEYFKSTPSCSPNTINAPIDHISSLEYWALSRTTSSNPSSSITLYATTYSQATDRSRLVVALCFPGAGWASFGNANPAVPGASGPVTSFSTMNGVFPTLFFTLASLDPSPVNPLPIKLISLDASKISDTKSSINWELDACCSANAKFEIQKARKDRGFITVASVGGSTTNRFYDFFDNDLQNGINYYRLKMIDEDGKITYSKVVAILNGISGLVLTSLTPTVINNTAILTVASSGRQKLDLAITDMQGRILLKHNYTVTAGNTNIELPLNNLAAGVYQLTGITAEGKTNSIRFIK